VKVVLKEEVGRGSRLSGGKDMGTAGFCGPSVFGCISQVVVDSECVRDFRTWSCDSRLLSGW
jgi:hypothetical protein